MVSFGGRIWAENWNEGAVYSPDGMIIQFDVERSGSVILVGRSLGVVTISPAVGWQISRFGSPIAEIPRLLQLRDSRSATT